MNVIRNPDSSPRRSAGQYLSAKLFGGVLPEKRPGRRGFRPALDLLEQRQVLAAGAATGLVGPQAAAAVLAPSQDQQASHPLLQQGSRGEAVKDLQRTLVGLGYGVGPAGVDGDFGPDTKEAVVAFQEDHPPLEVDGIVGPQTWAALDRAQSQGGQRDPGQLAIAEARRWLGYREGPGDNQNRFSAYFHRPAEPWCADFVSYIFEKADYPIGRRGEGFASVENMVAWFRRRGDWDSQPKVGAVVAFNWHDGGSIYDHVGIVTRVTGSQITYISGNTTAPGGGRNGVFEKTMDRDSSSIIGYGHR
jgi:hypothetical protein